MKDLGHELARAAFLRLLEIIISNPNIKINDADISPTLKFYIRRLTQEDVKGLGNVADKFVRTKVLLVEMENEIIGIVKDYLFEKTEIDQFIHLGASSEMMARFFGVNRRRYSELRVSLGISESDSAHKPRMLPQYEVEEVIAVWQQFRRYDEIKRFSLVAQATSQRLRDIEHIIKEYEYESYESHEAIKTSTIKENRGL